MHNKSSSLSLTHAHACNGVEFVWIHSVDAKWMNERTRDRSAQGPDRWTCIRVPACCTWMACTNNKKWYTAGDVQYVNEIILIIWIDWIASAKPAFTEGGGVPWDPAGPTVSQLSTYWNKSIQPFEFSQIRIYIYIHLVRDCSIWQGPWPLCPGTRGGVIGAVIFVP